VKGLFELVCNVSLGFLPQLKKGNTVVALGIMLIVALPGGNMLR
jgi:hypothetical protein